MKPYFVVVKGVPGAPPTNPRTSPLEKRCIRYATLPGVDPELTSLDLYLPCNPYPANSVLYAHGGGWKNGDRSRVGGIPDSLCGHSFTLASADYRLTPKADFPAHAEDLAGAAAWIHNNLRTGDGGSLYLMGSSAGAHLVSLVATDPSFLNSHGLSPRILSGVIALDTRAFDIPHLMANLPRGGGGLYRDVFGDDPVRWAEASPISHIDRMVGTPRFMIAYTVTDPLRRLESERFAEALRREEVAANLVPLPGRKHSEIVAGYGARGDPTSAAVLRFLKGCPPSLG